MNLRFATRTQTPVSAIREIFARLPAIEKQRERNGLSPLINLSIGQPHIAANPQVTQRLAAMKMNQDEQGYGPAQGEPATLEAIARLYQHYYPAVNYKPSETMVTIGASGALTNLFSILVENADDVILTFEPFFGAYKGQVRDWGGTLQAIPTLQNNFRPTADGLEQALKQYPNAKALIMNYPNNPSGVSLTRAEVSELANVLEKYPEIFIIVDDVYRDFNNQEHVTMLDVAPQLKDRCMVINSGAKGLAGAPALRIGMVAAHEEVIKHLVARQTNSMSGVPSHTQEALRLAVESHLNNPANEWLMNAKKEYSSNVAAAGEAFNANGFTLSNEIGGAFYLLINAGHLIGLKIPDTDKTIETDLDIVNYFINAAGVAAVPGSGFGVNPKEGFMRISCAAKKELLLEAAERMGNAAKLLLQPVAASKAAASLSGLARLSLMTGMSRGSDDSVQVAPVVVKPGAGKK